MGDLIPLSQSHPKTHKANTGNLGGQWQSLREPLSPSEQVLEFTKSLGFQLQSHSLSPLSIVPRPELGQAGRWCEAAAATAAELPTCGEGRETQSGGLAGRLAGKGMGLELA